MNFDKVAICGSHSCGKTTLLEELKKISVFKFHPPIHELAAKFDPKSRLNMETQFRIMQQQAIAERTYLKNYGKFLSDRSVVDNIAYSTLVNKHALNRNNKSEAIYRKCYILSYLHLHMIPPPYDLLIFVDEILPYKESPHRNFSELKDQKFIYDFIKNEIKQLNIPIIYVSGTTNQRIDTILDYMSYNREI
jgi:nicotinamide riboside kinase